MGRISAPPVGARVNIDVDTNLRAILVTLLNDTHKHITFLNLETRMHKILNSPHVLPVNKSMTILTGALMGLWIFHHLMGGG